MIKPGNVQRFLALACISAAFVARPAGISAQPAATQPATRPSGAAAPFAARFAIFAALDAKYPPPAHPTVFTGASTFTLWGDIPETFKEFDALNRAFGGSRLGDLIEHLDTVVVKYKPKAVVIYGGNSDVTARDSAEHVFETYRKLIEQIHAALPDTQVFCLSIIPAPSRVRNIEQLDRVNELLRKHTATQPYMHYIDARFALSDAEHNPDPANYLTDMLHPNKQGYTKLAPVIRKSLHEALDAKPADK